MSLFAKSFLHYGVLVSVDKILTAQSSRVLNIWRDQTEPDAQAALNRAFNRIGEARAAVHDALQLIKEASK